MKHLTVKICVRSSKKLSFSLISTDPKVRIPESEDEIVFNDDVIDMLDKGAVEIRSLIISNDEDKLKNTGKTLCEILLPSNVHKFLDTCDQEYLYVDLEEDVINFPWEMLCLPCGKFIFEKFVCGRHLRIQNQIANPNDNVKKNFIIVANPDGTLPDAEKEGYEIKTILSKDSHVSYFGTGTNAKDIAHLLANAGGFHFSGHSNEKELIFKNDTLSISELENIGPLPFFTFLNSCKPSGGQGWKHYSSNVAKTFIRQGTHVLISPDTMITTSKATESAINVYKHLSLGSTVGKALSSLNRNNEPAHYTLYGNPLYKYKTRGNRMKAIVTAGIVLAFLIGIGSVLFFQKMKMGRPPENLTPQEKYAWENCFAGRYNGCDMIGQSLYNKGRYVEAKPLLISACAHGQSFACSYAADIFKIEGKISNEFDLRKKGCFDSKNAFVCFGYGSLLADTGKPMEAIDLLKDYCDSKAPNVCTKIGLIAEATGDKNQASFFYKKACDFGANDSCVSYSLILLNDGKRSESKKILEKQCEIGTMNACAHLGGIYLDTGNIKKAHILFKKECNENSSHPLQCTYPAAYLMQKGLWNQIKYYYEIACKLGDKLSCDQLKK